MSDTNDTMPIDTDNSSNFENQEPSVNDDNSDDIQNKEPEEENGNQNKEQIQEGQGQSKFKTLEEATKSYSELEKKLGEQSNELGDLRKKAEQLDNLQQQIEEQRQKEALENGFNTVSEFETHREVIGFETDEYEKHLSECEYPDEMKNLLNEYRKNPTKEILSTIEAEFSTDTVKDVAAKTAIFKGQLQVREQEALQKEVEQSAINYLDENVKRYREEFNNPAFIALYGEAFRAYGCDLNTDKFVELMKQYGESCIKLAGIKNGINNENSKLTDEFAGTTNVGNTYSDSNVLNMNQSDMINRIKSLV